MQSEAEIIRGCQKNAATAQQMLYVKFAPILKGICVRYLKDPEEAKDVLHDGFMKIFKVIGKYKGEGSFEGWLKRIMLHVTLDHIKKTKRLSYASVEKWEMVEKYPESDHLSEVEKLLDTGFGTQDLLAILHRVQLEYASVFNMFYIDHLSHKEIAEVLEIDENTSRTRLFRARLLVKKELELELAKRQSKQWM